MRIGVIGGGVVGRATARAFLEHVSEVRVHDAVKERSTHTKEEVLGCDLAFVCINTPALPCGACDLGPLLRFFESVAGLDTYFVLRSTVPVGTTRRIVDSYRVRICHSPEFLTARCSVADAQLPARNIVGVVNKNGDGGLGALYRERFPGVRCIHMTSDESEAVKLFQNSLFAVKVSLFNELHAFAAEKGLDWSRVLSALMADGRIAHAHTKVPGPSGHFGFGGDCLPKDIASLAAQMGDEATILRAAIARNERDQRRTV